MKAERGGSVTLPCKYRGDGVVTVVKWLTSDSFIVEYRGEQLKPRDISPHYSTVPNGKDKNDFSIILSPVEIHHDGIFTCSINVRGKADIVKTIKLEVTGPKERRKLLFITHTPAANAVAYLQITLLRLRGNEFAKFQLPQIVSLQNYVGVLAPYLWHIV